MKKRALSLLLAIVLVCSFMSVTAFAANYDDTDGHWAEDAINRFSDYSILQGSNGSFDPNGQLTRAQMATIITKLMKLPEAESAGFTDVASGAWYEDAINRCAAAGIMLGSNGKANPNASITRQDAMVMLGRALGISEVANPDLSNYTDASSVSSYAKGLVAAMIKAGIVKGETDTTIGALNNITRAATVTILDRAISEYANTDGQTVTSTGTGIVLVVADNVTVTGDVQDVVVADGTDGNTVEIKDATVTGTVIIKASAIVRMSGKTSASAVSITESAESAALTVGEGSSAETVTTSAPKSNITIEGEAKNVQVDNTATDATVTIASTGTADGVKTDAKNTKVEVSGAVDTVEVTENATSTTLTANEGGAVKNVTSEADATTIEGKGTVDNAKVNGDNATVATDKTTVTIGSDADNATVSGNKADKDSTVVSGSSSNNSSSASNSSSSSNSGTTQTPASTTPTVAETSIDSIISEGITSSNAALGEIASLSALDSVHSNHTITVSVSDGDATILTFYTDVVNIILNALKSNTDKVATVTVGSETLDVNESITTTQIANIIKSCGLKDGENPVSLQTKLSALEGQTLTITVNTTGTVAGHYNYTLSFAAAA